VGLSPTSDQSLSSGLLLYILRFHILKTCLFLVGGCRGRRDEIAAVAGGQAGSFTALSG